MNKLQNKRVLITGGGQGLGQAIVEQFIGAGADVAIHYHSSKTGAEQLKTVAVQAGRKAEIFQADLTQEAAASGLVKAAAKFLGGLDVLVNNAGDMIGRRRLEEVDGAFWEKVISVNVTSMMWVTQAAVPELIKAGQSSIVNLSSLAGRKGGHAGSLVYSTAKGAVLTWTRALANELGPKGVRVNALAPPRLATGLRQGGGVAGRRRRRFRRRRRCH